MAKITFVLPSINISGGIRVIAIYAQKLQSRGHDVFVVAPPYKVHSRKQKIINLFDRKNAHRARAEADKFFRDTELKPHILEKYRPVREEDVPDADFVIGTWWETMEWVWALSSKKGNKIHFVQGHEVFDFIPLDRAHAVYKMPVRKISVSQWLGDIMVNEYDSKDSHIVPNSVDQREFFSSERVKNSIPTFGFIYSDSVIKNSAASIRELTRYREKSESIRVIAFGQIKLYKNDKLPPWIEYHVSPTKEKIREIYASCDAWLFTSNSEGFGLPILEAMACGTPVIATRAGAAPQLVNRNNGALVEDDGDALFEEISRFSNISDEDWKMISNSALEQIRQYGWDNATDLFEKALYS